MTRYLCRTCRKNCKARRRPYNPRLNRDERYWKKAAGEPDPAKANERKDQA